MLYKVVLTFESVDETSKCDLDSPDVVLLEFHKRMERRSDNLVAYPFSLLFFITNFPKVP